MSETSENKKTETFEMDPEHAKEPSAVAQEISRLKSATIAASKDRERLPQPLFWSLFHSELDKLRRKKALDRDLSDLLDG